MRLWLLQFPPESDVPFASIRVAARTKLEACTIVAGPLELPIDAESPHPLGRGTVAINHVGQSAALEPGILGAAAR